MSQKPIKHIRKLVKKHICVGVVINVGELAKELDLELVRARGRGFLVGYKKGRNAIRK